MRTVLIFKTCECKTAKLDGISEPECLTYRLAFLLRVLRLEPDIVIDYEWYAQGLAYFLTSLAALLVVETPEQAVRLDTIGLRLQLGGNNG
jgi:hypothetical protein